MEGPSFIDENESQKLVQLTSEIVAAYLSNNSLPTEEIPNLVGKVHAALLALDGNTPSKKFATREPAVPIEDSITDEHIICLEDGKKLKMLKRYLRTHFDMSPQEYREKWGLPLDYPMVAPSYAANRSELAKQIGLGQNSGNSKG